MSRQEHVAKAPAAALAPSNAAEIVTARKVSHSTAHAAPVTHYRSQSKSSSTEAHGSPRMMPSPKPPPCSALPPTPGLSASASPKLGVQGLAIRGSNAASFATPGVLSKGIRKTLRHLSAALSEEEHAELVQKVLSDLRPAHASPTVRASSRASRPNSLALSPRIKTATISPETASNKPESLTAAKAVERRLSSSSQSAQSSSSSSSNGSLGSNEKLVMSQTSISASNYSTPLLSQSRTPTPTSPASPNGHDNTDEKVRGSEEVQKDLLTPTAALERLKACENRIGRNSHSPLRVTVPKEAKSTHSTAVGSPTHRSAAEEEAMISSPGSTNGAVLGPRVKRSSSYRKSVPTFEQLNGVRKELGTSEGVTNGSAATSDRASSRSSTNTEAPSWISSLTTLEAIRMLAYQQSFESLNQTASAVADTNQASSAVVGPGSSSDEVSALRYALSFTLARADKLAEALNRASEEKIKVETELEILRRNVLSMLGSKDMFGPPSDASPNRHYNGVDKGERKTHEDVVQERGEERFEDTRVKQKPVVDRAVAMPASVSQSVASLPRSSSASAVARPPRAGKVATKPASPAAAIATAAAPTKPSGGVSIASLRKNTPAGATVSSSTAQRYAPDAKGHSGQDEADAPDSDDDDDDDEFELYTFGRPPARKPLPEVSMTDFLNASRMSKSEIDERDARRALAREDLSDLHSADSSTSSHAPLAGAYSMRSLDSNRKGFFKGFTKLVDHERGKRTSRRTSLTSKPSMTMLATSRDAVPITRSQSSSANTDRTTPSNRFTLAYEEESIIPAYPGGGDRRHKTMSLSSALRESLEKQHLSEANPVGWR